MLLNLWATWCVPCRKEMPTLDALQQRLGGPDFEVVAVNIDTRDPDKPKAWLKEIGISKLAYYADPTAKTFQDLKAIGRAFGMPTTLLIDRQGCEIGTIAGPAEWASDDAVKLIQAALGNNETRDWRLCGRHLTAYRRGLYLTIWFTIRPPRSTAPSPRSPIRRGAPCSRA